MKLSPLAKALGVWLLQNDNGMCKQYDKSMVLKAFESSTDVQLLDAAEELKEKGAVSTRLMIGGNWIIGATHRMAFLIPDGAGFDPEADLRAVIQLALSKEPHESLNGDEITKATNLDPRRVSYAVLEAADRGLLDVTSNPGCAPYYFTWIQANRRTRALGGPGN